MSSSPTVRRPAYAAARRSAEGRLSRLIIVLTAAVAAVAIGPIAWGLIAGTPSASPARTAFATAPAGTYAVVTRSEGATDVIGVVRADQPSQVIEVARVPHLDGFTPVGTASPGGRFVAVVVADAGTPVLPSASLLVVDLETGRVKRLASGMEPGQRPLWSPDGQSVIVSRPGAAGSAGVIDVLRVTLDGGSRLLWSQTALGVYPVGWRDGRLLTVAIDERGSTLQADGQDLVHLSTSITRDWAVAPDGEAIAFIEVTTAAGVRYEPRVAWLSGDGVSAQAAAPGAGMSLGATWKPGAGPIFGDVPGRPGEPTASAQALRAGSGFDIPLAYSPDGSTLIVTHWDGSSFDAPGRPALHLIRGDQRVALEGFGGFLGWVQR